MKKTLIISLIILVLAGIGFGVFYFLYKPAPAAKTVSLEYKVTKISDDSVVSPISSFDNNAVWYFNSSGSLFRRSVSGSDYSEYTFPTPITNFSQAYWPKTTTDIIIRAETNSGTIYSYYDAINKNFKILPRNVLNLDWMPDGKRILYVWKASDGKSQQLVLANADTSGFKAVSNLFYPDFTVKVSPDGNWALLIRSVIQDVNKIYRVNLQTGQFDTVVNDGKNLEAKWLDSNRFLFVQSVDGKNNLELFNTATSQVTNLGLPVVLSNVTVDSSARFAYVASSVNSSDVILKVDLNSGQSSQIYKFDATTKPTNLFMNDQTIMFVNVLDGKLYSLGQ